MATSVDAMTSEQLREQLYHELQGSGVLEKLKSQLRQKLTNQLTKAAPLGIKKSAKMRKRSKSFEARSTTLDDQIASGIVADYLKKTEFEYTLSVFLPEAGVNVDKLYSMEDLVQYLRIPPSSSLYDKLIHGQQSHSLLEQLLKGLVECSCSQITKPSSDSMTPTPHVSPKTIESSPKKKTSVAELLQALDQSYAQKAEEQNLRTQQNLEERLLTFQRELESQHKHQLETELSLYKNRELVKVRMEEREKYQRELAEQRHNTTMAHQKKIEELRKTEHQMLERYRKKEQDLEAGLYAQRQSLLAELNSLKLRETELKGEVELKKKSISVEEERLVKIEQQLIGREKAIERSKAYYESMAEEKAQKYKLELESKLQLRQNELSHREAEIKCDKDKMTSLQSEMTKLSAELQTEKDKTDKLQSLLHEAMTRQTTLQGQKDALQQRLDKVDDYDLLQKRCQDLSQELAVVEKRLSDYKRKNSDSQRLIKELQSKVPHPTHELEVLKRELEEIRKAHHKELYAIKNSNSELRRQLVVQTDYAGELQKTLDEQMLQLLSAQREVKDIHIILEQLRLSQGKAGLKKNGALPNRNTAVNKLVPMLNNTRHYSHPSHPHISRSSHPHTIPTVQSDTPSCIAHLTQPPSPPSQNPNVSDQLLIESRATIARLEKEAQELEATCHNLQRASHAPSLIEPIKVLNITRTVTSPFTPMAVDTHKEQVSHPLESPASIPVSLTHPAHCTGSHQLRQANQLAHTSTVWASPTTAAYSPTPPSRQTSISLSTATHKLVSNMVASSTVQPLQPQSLATIEPQASSSVQPLTTVPEPQASSTVQPQASQSSIVQPQSLITVQPQASSTVQPQSLTTVQPHIQLTSVPVTAIYSPAAPSTSTQQVKSKKEHSVISTSPTNALMTSNASTAIAQPTIMTSPVTQPKTLRISLDELWKSSQEKSQLALTTIASSSLIKPPEDELQKCDTEIVHYKSKHLESDTPPTSPVVSSQLDTQAVRNPPSHKDNGMDPIMLKYMEIVKQNKQNATAPANGQPLAETEEDKLDYDIPPLSQGSGSYGGFSDKDNDPFEDW